jgi:pimeloyl-ACP methyl ester carboxylesterase
MADVVANGVRFHVQRLGSGQRTLVFIHGILIDNLSGFYLTLGHALSPEYALVMYDLRGHGRSEQPPEGYSLSQMVLDLKALLGELGLAGEGITLVGNSSGVPIALAYALRFPEQVEGMVLIDGVVNPRRFAQMILETLMAQDGDPHPDARLLWTNWLQQHYVGEDMLDRDGADTQILLHRLHAQRRSPLLDTARGLVYRTQFAEDMRLDPPYEEEDLRTIGCPVLGLYGDESDITGEGKRLAQLVQDCHLVLVPNAGHGILRQASDRMRREVLDWLKRTDAVAR